MKSKTISGKALIKQVASIAGYYDYEVADLLNALSIAISENATKGISTGVRGIGVFTPKSGYPLKGKSNLTGGEFSIITPDSLSLKIDTLMKNSLNNPE